ncbi:MAG: porin family protein [Pseudomonadota bacterium]
MNAAITLSMKTVRIALATVSIMLATALVYADETIYAGTSFGRIDLNESIDFPIDDDGSAFRFDVGYGFANNIAIEGSYINLGEFTGNSGLDSIGVSGDVEGLGLSAVFTLPLSDHWSAQVSGGLLAWESELTTPLFREKRDGTDPYYGIGVEGRFNDNLAITADYQRYDFDGAEANALYFGARFRF